MACSRKRTESRILSFCQDGLELIHCMTFTDLIGTVIRWFYFFIQTLWKLILIFSGNENRVML